LILCMNNVKLVNIPLASHFKFFSCLCPSNKEENYYMYAMICKRLDISHVFDVINRYMENLGREDWVAVKWVLQYLKGTSSYCITYNGCNGSICGYVDSYFVGDLEKKYIHFKLCLYSCKEAI
jgi:hypothetical protein